MKYRHLRRTVIAVLAAAAFILVMSVLAVRLLASQTACRAAARTIERQAAAAGVELDIGSLSWRLLPLEVLLHDVTLSASGVEADIDRLELGLARVRVARRSIELDTVAADGVRVRLRGTPRPPPSRGTPWVRVTVQRLHLRNLELEGSDLAGSVSVGLDGVDAAWATEGAAVRGFLRIEQSRVSARGLEPFAVGVQARFSVAEDVHVPYWRLSGEGISLEGSGVLEGSGALHAEAQGELDLEELDRVVRAKGVLEGRCRVRLEAASDADELVRAEVQAEEVVAAGFPVQRLRGHMAVGKRGLTGTIEEARFHGGVLRGSYTLARIGAPFPHHVRVEMDGVELSRLLTNLGVPPAGLSASADIRTELQWRGRAFKAAAGEGVATLHAGDDGLPVAGVVKARFDSEGLLHFAAVGLELGGSRVHWQGPLTIGTWEPAWSVRADPMVLEEIIPVVNRLIGSEILPSTITGSGELAVGLSGPWRQLRVATRVEARSMDWEPLHLDRFVGEAVVAGSAVDIGPVRYRIGGGDGEVRGRVSWAEQAVDISFRGNNLPIERVLGWLGVDAGCSGGLSFTGGLRGTPSAPRGSWAVGLTDVNVASLPLGDGSATVALDGGIFSASGVGFTGGLRGNGWWDVGAHEVGGELEWPNLPAVLLRDPLPRLLGDKLDTRLRFHWPLSAPPEGRFEAVGDSCDLLVTADADGVDLRGELATALDLSAKLTRTDGGGLEGHGELRLAAADELLASVLPQADVPLQGHGRVVFDVSWPRLEAPRVTGRLESLELELDGRPVTLLEPAEFAASTTGVEVGGALLGLLDDEIFVRWSMDAQGTMQGNVAGTLDALLLRFLVPEWAPAGRATGVVEILGTPEHPRFEGIAEVAQLSFLVPGTRYVVSGVTGTLLLSSDEVALEDVEFRFMNGNGSCSGRIGRPRNAIELTLGGTVADLDYPLFPGLTPRLGGEWKLRGPVDDLELSGALEVVRAELRRKDDVATILFDWFGDPVAARPSGGLTLDIDIEADHTIEARSPFLHLIGSADLHVAGSSAAPSVLGNVEFQEGGDFTFQGVRYELDRGTVTFSDPTGVDPHVDLEARAWVSSYQLTVRLTGTFDHLVPVLSSDPPLPEDEIISVLALGYRNDSFGGGAVGVGLASTLLTRQLNAELDRRARSLLSIDQVRVDPFAEASTGNPTARITVVKQLSPTWTVIVQSNLSANRQEVIVSRWYLAPGLFIEASRDIDESVGVDIKVRRRY